MRIPLCGGCYTYDRRDKLLETSPKFKSTEVKADYTRCAFGPQKSRWLIIFFACKTEAPASDVVRACSQCEDHIHEGCRRSTLKPSLPGMHTHILSQYLFPFSFPCSYPWITESVSDQLPQPFFNESGAISLTHSIGSRIHIGRCSRAADPLAVHTDLLSVHTFIVG